MNQHLSELQRAIDNVLVGQPAHIPQGDEECLLERYHRLREELDVLEVVHDGIHRAQSRGSLILALVMLELDQVNPVWRRRLKQMDTRVPVREAPALDLKSLGAMASLRRDQRREAESLSLEIGDAVFKVDMSIREQLKAKGWEDRGARWPGYFAVLGGLGEMRVADYLGPPPQMADAYEELLPREVVSTADEGRERFCQAKLRDELNCLEPPLAWGEVIYWVLKSQELTKGERLRDLNEFLGLWRRRYCLNCDKLFTPSRYNPSRLVCPRCSARERKRRERERKKAGKSLRST